MNPKRLRPLNAHAVTAGPVLYWMSRDQRVEDNWALLIAQAIARKNNAPLWVAFALAPGFLGATWRHYHFMLAGLRGVEASLNKLDIPFYLLQGNPGDVMAGFVEKESIGTLVCDFDPSHLGRAWRGKIAAEVTVPMYEVDARNIVPAWIASPKFEVGARTLRPKIQRLLPEFLEEYPAVEAQNLKLNAPIDWTAIEHTLTVDREVKPVEWITPGSAAGRAQLDHFLEFDLKDYATARNNPALDGQSNLSPYLHFGQLSSQRVALEVRKRIGEYSESVETYLEELTVRRELSDNFCLYNPHYDRFEGFPAWAQKSLNAHRQDPREFVYSRDQFEQAETHDALWNAAQRQMTAHGKMHGYMRMYWAKKILEWTESPEQALEWGIYLNDKYELDGRDANGWNGMAWAIGGTHDRPWFERPVFGAIRYMNANGAKKKFDVAGYIAMNPSVRTNGRFADL